MGLITAILAIRKMLLCQMIAANDNAFGITDKEVESRNQLSCLDALGMAVEQYCKKYNASFSCEVISDNASILDNFNKVYVGVVDGFYRDIADMVRNDPMERANELALRGGMLLGERSKELGKILLVATECLAAFDDR